MPWYSSGTVSATNDSNIVTGSSSLHEVIGIASNTQLTIKPAYAGTTGSGKQYAVAPILGYDKDLSDAFNRLRLQFRVQLPWVAAPTLDEARKAGTGCLKLNYSQKGLHEALK